MLSTMDAPTQDWLLEHHKDAYAVQREASHKIRERIYSIIGMMIPLGGAILYIDINYPYHISDCSVLFFIMPALLSLSIFLMAICFALYCVGIGVQYACLPDCNDIQEYAESLSTYAKEHPAEQIDVLRDIKANLVKEYAEAATENFRRNARQTRLIIWTTQMAVASFLFLLLSLPSYFYAKSPLDSPPTKVIISEPVRIAK